MQNRSWVMIGGCQPGSPGEPAHTSNPASSVTHLSAGIPSR